jgi:replicative DNA helicase
MDRELRFQILRAVVRDRSFLKQAWRDVRPGDFPEREEVIVTQAAVTFWEKYEEPLGAMLQSEVTEAASKERLGAEAKQKLKDLVTKIQRAGAEAVSVKALVDRVKALKQASFYSNGVDEIIAAHEEGTLSAHLLQELVERANRELTSNTTEVTEYFTELEKRIERRSLWDEKRSPMFLIDALDEKISGPERGHLAFFLAPPNAGKGLALIHMGQAYALQGLKVLHLTLEDPKDVVENRLDASMTGIPLDRLRVLPNRLRKRWKRARRHMRGNYRIVDGTEGGWTIARMEQLLDQEKRNGFEADVFIVDYDDEIICEKVFKGESARRFEFAEIYRRMRQAAVKHHVIWWTAAQSTRKGEHKKFLTMTDVAEDISKVRKAFLAIGIGADPKVEDMKGLYVIRNRCGGRSRFGVEIMSDFASAIFYDRERSLRMRRLRDREKAEE